MSSYGPFAERTPRGQEGWIEEVFRPVPHTLRLRLEALDGLETFTYIIWRGSDPTSIVGFESKPGGSFMQAAGSADQMTVEVRLAGPDGQTHLYTVGRPEPADETTLIPISQTRAVRVFSNEVFTADEAAVIFYTYYLTDAVAQPYVLRELDLSQELSEER
ncbi:hypothetical protein M4D51_04145 [Microbacterium sp. p3-SID338]|uniref:hypothetical protein n=1 Tax=unclassified Microbacterium TaxID=2609290 RepID=UPI0007874143|nr:MULTISPECIES: hypothetical protein [unclassified Microbacterium]KYJ99007.1 hypothetical protein AUV07_09055 [Microbacterium sp. CH1]MCT1394911.1 hypothetical protein [Microbacterium sp. p3-SID338]PMC02249.1 hypothetical protein CJ226_14900 [Microbacterium sp. UMB0228]